MSEKYVGYYHSPIGILEIVTTRDAVLSATFVEKEEEIVSDTKILREVIRQVDEYFKGKRRDLEIECEIEGKGFQKRAWNARTDQIL
ncbi:hypothetical protein [Metabacillus litoralis]|uniref:hypothetical protein n=1 Tax=Metabacillus litoralis TaxID=152268 RepID=UPI003084094F